MERGNLPAQIVDYPVFPQSNWGGYFHKQDPTVLPPNVLTGGSFNCFIPDTDLITTRRGSQLFGQTYTENAQIVGHAKKFSTAQGNEFEVRVYQSSNTDIKDVVQVSSSSLGTNDFFTLTEDPNPLTPAPAGHRYTFAEWWDESADNTRVDVARLVWVNGTTKIFSWTGSVVQVLSVTAGTITIDASIYTDWESQGFISTADGGNGEIIVNGVKYVINSGWATDTVDVGDTTGIMPGNWVFDAIHEDLPVNIPGSTMIWDYCSMVKNQVYYSNWKTRSVWASNAFNRLSSQIITSTNAVLDDMSISGSYTGPVDRTFKVVIDSITPAINEQTFTTTSVSGGTNTSYFDTTGYTGSGSRRYKMVMISDCVFTFVGASIVGTFLDGEYVVGQTSGTVLKFIFGADNAGGAVGAQYISGTPDTVGQEQFVGTSSGATGNIFAFLFSNCAQFYRKIGSNPWVQITGLAGQSDFPPVLGIFQLALVGSYALNDGLTFEVTQVGGNITGDYYELHIQSQQPDTFQWQVDDNSPVQTLEPIDGTPQLLQNGISIQFSSLYGHTLGDSWTITVKPEIDEGWRNFYFSVPSRLPGEAFRANLPSNFWTMAPQEDFMYINTQHGQWIYIELLDSADLKNQSFIVQPLKQSSQNKVLYPYMIGYMDNYLVYVSERKTLDYIGRKELVELPQIGNLSDPVKLDFLNASFTNGSIEYWDKKLWVTSPNDGTMFCYDSIKNYWQPPQVIPENGILSIVGDALITHSNIRNQTNTLFVGTNDNGSAFTTRMRFPLNDYGSRWESKSYNFTFIEGYIVGAPIINYRVFLDPNGCHGIKEHPVSPIPCLPVDRASLGKDYLGSHGLGNDPVESTPYFQEIYKDVLSDFHFAQIELSCETLDQDWSILSVGLNTINSNTNNANLTSNQILIP